MSVDRELIERLLKRVEDETIDFKETEYDFGTKENKHRERKRADFVKDIVSMYNTPRIEPAYIMLGVRKSSDGNFKITGVSSHIDDAELRSKFDDWIHPVPRFQYEPAEYDGKQIALITILPEQSSGPCLPLKDFPNPKFQVLRQHQLYLRRGSVNNVANGDEQKKVYAWFAGQANDGRTPPEGMWGSLLDDVRGFGSDYYYGLIVPRLDGEDIANLGCIDWAFVIDFDQMTDVDGLLSYCREGLEPRRPVHLVKHGDRPTLNIGRGTYWYCAAGLSGHSATIPKSANWMDWNRSYGTDLPRVLNLLSAVSAERPMVLVVLWYGELPIEYLHTAMQHVTASFGEAVHIVVVVANESPEIRQLCELFEARVFEIPLHQFCLGLEQLAPQRSLGDKMDVTLPSTSGAPVSIPAERLAWLSEEIQLVHIGEGLRASDTHPPGSEFLRGNEITWYDLGLNYDVPRENTRNIKNKILTGLGKRRAQQVNLYHAPGSGGTTVLRRVLWDLRSEFPCLLLQRTKPEETTERLAYIASKTGKSILLAIDAGAITDREADALYERVAAAHIPVLLFQVIRSHDCPSERSVLYLDSQLERIEAERFVHFLEREAPSKSDELKTVLKQYKPKTHTPFYLALVAFGRDFIGIQNYVQTRLKDLTDIQKECVAFLAIAHYFGQRAVPAQMFAPHFDVPSNISVKFKDVLPSPVLEILVESQPGVWRTVHPVVAEECMRQIFTPVDADQELWLQRLSHWALQFIEFCRGVYPIALEDGLDLVRRVFVYRENSEFLGSERAGSSQFSEASEVIKSIPVQEGRLQVLKQLTEAFPDEAHFWAHLGRFHSIFLKEYDSALEAVNHAIILQPDDHVLHHMKGMVLRSHVYQMISDKHDQGDVISMAKSAEDAFLEARTLAPDDAHGYISEAQMILRVLDYYGMEQRLSPIVAASSLTAPKWVRGSVQNVEELLAQVRHNREGESPSSFEEDCRAKLDALYGDYSTALQRWDSMLSRNDVYLPPIRRQLVWTYLARRNRNWNDLKPKELRRSVELLSDNLDEEPHNERNLRLWLQAVRAGDKPPTIDTVTEKVAYWHANSDSLESAYYLFILHVIKAFEGSSLAHDNANRLLEECRTRSRSRRNRTKSFEWFAQGEGLKQLVHQDVLGQWDRDEQFWSDPSPLDRLEGVVGHIRGPEAGEIEITSGLKAFYVPGTANHYKGETENRRVNFYLGFSYEGLRAWKVKLVE